MTPYTLPAPLSAPLPAHSDGIHVNLAELLRYKSYVTRYLPPSMSVWSYLNGQHRSRRFGRGMNFSEVRPYQIGDDVRSIDWRVTARTGKTHTKLYTEEREQPIILLVDLSFSMKFGSQLLLKSVQACHFAALLSWLACSQKDRIGAVIFNGISLYQCKPTARRQGTLHVLNTLINAHKELIENKQALFTHHLHQAMEQMSRLCPKGSDITLISDFYSLVDRDKKRLIELGRHNQIQCVRIFDPLEKGETAFRGHELIADKEQSLWLNFASKYTRESLANQYQKHQDFVKNMARSLAIPLHSLNAGKPLLQQLDKIANN